MPRSPRHDWNSLPDSPYAAELRRDGSALLRFVPELEAEYLHSRLLDSQNLIRIAAVFGVVLTVARCIDHQIESTWNPYVWLCLACVTLSSLAMGAIAWSPYFERIYLPWARLLVPLRNAIIAEQVATSASNGQTEMLMVLPITFIGPFFFLGLPLRTSLWSCGVTIASYLFFSMAFGLPPHVALRTDMLLVGGVVACVIAVWNLEKTSRRSFLEGRLITELAQRDGLTGTLNRRVFDERLEQLWQHAIDQAHGIAILFIDIDHFKTFNDRYGHQAGDQALRQVAQTIQKLVQQPLDILCRYGGEEFAAILYDVTDNKALEIAESMRRAVADLAPQPGAAARITISVGVAVLDPTPDRTPAGALQLADQALYGAKVQGRNRVEFRSDDEHRCLVTGVFATTTFRKIAS